VLLDEDQGMDPRPILVNAFWVHYLLALGELEFDRADAPMDDPPASIPARYWPGETEPADATDYEWSEWEVSSIIRAGGIEAIDLLADLAAAAPTDAALGYLGAGPVEDLVNLYGPAVAHGLDAAIRREPRLSLALDGVRVGTEELEPTTSLVAFFGLLGV
jgi:hypothetical protein